MQPRRVKRMVRLHDIMSVDVVAITPQATLREAVELLAAEHVSGLPVVAGSELVGVVSATDLLDFDAERPGVPVERAGTGSYGWEEGPGSDEAPEEPAEAPAAFFTDLRSNVGTDVYQRFDQMDRPEWDVLEEHSVEEIMTRELLTLPPDTDVREAAREMLRAGVHRVLVVEDGELVGVASTTDMVKAVAQHGLAG